MHPSDTPAIHTGTPGTRLRERLHAADQAVRAGRLAEAVAAYQEVLAIRPDLAAVQANLGFALAALQRYAEAVPHFQSMLEAHPDEVPVLLALAAALQKLARQREAERHYRHAIAIEPDCVPGMLGLGICLRSQSRLDEACACFERAALVEPACVEAYYLASTLRHFAAGDPLLAQCEDLRPKVARMPPLAQARHGFALGKMLEDAGRYDEAFAAYAAGNRARASQFVLDESGEDELLQRTREVFDAALLTRGRAQPASADRVPVFVVGMPRSGTTLIEQILATHPDVHGAGEVSDLWDVLLARIGTPDAWPECARAFSDADWRTLGAAYLDRAWRVAPQATHVVNKMPLNYRYAGLIRMMLPQARIIHARRNPLDTCWSCYTRLFDGDNLAYTYDLGSLGRYYVRYAGLMRHWRNVLPPEVMLEVAYEDLVTATEAVTRRMLAFAGLPWDPRCLDFHRNPRVVDTASRAQVRRPVYASSVGRWQHFASHLQPLRDALARTG